MAPSTSLRSRIAAFENGTIVNDDPDENGVREDVHDYMDVPISPTASSMLGPLLKPTASPIATPPISRPDSPNSPGGKTSLVDFSEFELPTAKAPPQLPARPSSSASKTYTSVSSRDSASSFDASRFSAEFSSSRSADSHTSSSSVTSPPLPPRKPTYLQTTSTTPSSPINVTTPRPGMLTSNDTNDGISSSWYKVPQLSSPQFLDVQAALNASPRRSHGHALSTSSFQSVSLSSDGDGPELDDEPSGVSTPSVSDAIAAFNNRSVETGPAKAASENGNALPYVPRKSPRSRDNSATTPTAPTGPSPTLPSPSTKSPPPLPARKPTVPARPSAPSSTSSSTQSVSQFSIRRVAPPPVYPPAKPSFPQTTAEAPTTSRTVSSSSIDRRKAPIPPAARRRYETVFDKNVANRSTKYTSPGHTPLSSSGWRGMDGLDDVTTGDNGPKMSGALIKSIWECSKLPKATLRRIW